MVLGMTGVVVGDTAEGMLTRRAFEAVIGRGLGREAGGGCSVDDTWSGEPRGFELGGAWLKVSCIEGDEGGET